MSADNCVFCDRSQFEERICGETKSFWIIATLGQITNGGYLLLVPKRHVECLGAMKEDEIDLMCAIKQRIYSALGYINEGSSLTIFEHGIVGQSIQHAHLHIIPARCDITEKIYKDFLWSDVTKLPVLQSSWQTLRKLYALKKEPYLLWKDGGMGIKICWNPRSVPQQYMRVLIADALGRPELANWRNADPSEDKKRWSDTVKKLKPLL